MKKRMKMLATTLAAATILTSMPNITVYAAANEGADASEPAKAAQTEASQSASSKGTDLKGTYESYRSAQDAKYDADQKVFNAKAAADTANQNADNAKNAVKYTTDEEANARQNAENAFQKAAADANRAVADANAAFNAAQKEKAAADAAKSTADTNVTNATKAVTDANQKVKDVQTAIDNSDIKNSKEYTDNETARQGYTDAKSEYDAAATTYQNAVSEKADADSTVNELSKNKEEAYREYQSVLQDQAAKQQDKDAKDAAVTTAENDKAAAEKAVSDANAKITSIQDEITAAEQAVENKKKDVAAADANVKDARRQLEAADEKAATGVLGFLNWMREQPGIKDEQKADINEAIAYYNQYKDLTIEQAIDQTTYLNDKEKAEYKNKIHDRLHHEGELEERQHKVIIQGKNAADATSLEAMESALVTMEHLNKVRKDDTYYDLDEIHTNMYLMVGSEVMANIEAFITDHSHFNVGDNECMTTGRGDDVGQSYRSIEALYTTERSYLTQALEFFGYTALPTSEEELDKVWDKAGEYAESHDNIGHYVILSRNDVFGCGTKNEKATAVVLDGISRGLEKLSDGKNYRLYTVDELTAKFNAYKQSINEDELEKNLAAANEALVNANKAQADAETALSSRQDALKAAQAELETAQAVIPGKKDAVTIAKNAAEAAKTALDTATESANIKKNVADNVAAEYQRAVAASTEKAEVVANAQKVMQDKETVMNTAKAAYDTASQAFAALDDEYTKALTDAEKEADDAQAALTQCTAEAEAAAKRASNAETDLDSKQDALTAAQNRAAKMQKILEAGTGTEVTDSEFAYLNNYIKGIQEATKDKEAAIAKQTEADKKAADAKKNLEDAVKKQADALADLNTAEKKYKNAVAAAIVDYEFEKTSGTVWKETAEDAAKGLVITNEQEYDESSFRGVTVDGKELTKDVDYTVKKGSTDVTLLPAFLSKLGSGPHTIAFLYNYGVEPETSFSIQKETPAAGGGSGTVSGGGASGAGPAKADDTKKDDTAKDNHTEVSSFKDVPSNAWYSSAVNWIKDKGITSGTTPTTYSPDAPCTRAQMVTFLWRCAGSPAAKETAGFKDVNGKHFAKTAVAWAKENGITVGTSDTTFSPDQACTRAQMATFLWRFYVSRAAKQKGYTRDTDKLSANYKSGFSDIPEDFWAADGVYAMKMFGITSGTTPTTYSPDEPCTRAQMATFLYRMEQMAQKEFAESIVKGTK